MGQINKKIVKRKKNFYSIYDKNAFNWKNDTKKHYKNFFVEKDIQQTRLVGPTNIPLKRDAVKRIEYIKRKTNKETAVKNFGSFIKQESRKYKSKKIFGSKKTRK